jgi:hypothetical protein
VIVFTDNPPCQMRPGELHRLPLDSDRPALGYYVCCPRCWFISMVVPGEAVQIDETEGLTISGGAKCTYCLVEFGIRASEFHLVEGPDVRPVRYRK